MGSPQPDLRLLAQFTPLNRLSDAQRVLLQSHSKLAKYSKSANVLELGNEDGLEYFLLKGKVILISNDGQERVIEAGSESAKTPIALLQPRKYTVTAAEESVFLIVQQAALKALMDELPEEGSSTFGASDLETEKSASMLLSEIKYDLSHNRLVLPSFPDVALQISQLLELPDVSIEEVSQAISNDPAITVKLLKTCNSALYPAINNITSCQDAVIRLGLQTTKQLVSIFSMQELFYSENSFLQNKMRALWDFSREVACVAHVLADITPRLSPEKALLAGLIHEVGVIPILQYVERYPDFLAQEEKLDDAIKTLEFEVGQAILQEWGFEDYFIDVVQHASDVDYVSKDNKPGYAEVVIAARILHQLDIDPSFELDGDALPPCFATLGEDGLSLEQCKEALEEAHQRIDGLKSLLSIQK